jgi:methyl-accepting chemotaxis protein
MSQDSSEGARRRPPLHKRQYIVDRPFQYRLIGTLMAIWVANSIFFTLVLYFFFQGHVQEFYDLVPRPGVTPLLSLSSLFTVSIVFIFVFGFVVLGIIAVYMSNQIAGPLYRTKKCLDRVARGEFSFNLQFRQGDFLRDIPGVFNAMLEGLRKQAEADAEELRAIESAKELEEARRRARAFRERKEAQLGGESVPVREPEPASLSVH